MHKVNDLSQDFIQSWKKGWPEYIHMPEQDNRPIYEIAEKCAWIAQVSLEEEPGYRRVVKAIEVIATYCRSSKIWRSNNLHQINKALQSIVLEIQANNKARKEAEYELSGADRVYKSDQAERERIEHEMEECSKKCKEEYDKNWTEEDEIGYQAYMRRITPGRVIAFDLAKEKHINKAL